MLDQIGDYLEAQIIADLGITVYTTQAQLPIRSVRRHDEQPATQYPDLVYDFGPVAPEYTEFGAGVTTGIDRTYEVRLYVSTPAASKSAANAAVETLAERLEAWIFAHNGMGGLTDGTRTVYDSMPGPWEPMVQGSGTQWAAYFMMPLYIKTTQ